MRFSKQLSLIVLAIVTVVGCGEEKSDANYDAALLAKFRSAIPTEGQLSVTSPNATTTAIGQPAQFPNDVKGMVFVINFAARWVVATMRFITAFPPTFYNADAKEFYWGPWDNDDGVGQWAAYVRENPPTDDFKYTYALLRLMDGDPQTAQTIILGGATPGDAPDEGIGFTIWDVDARNHFDDLHDPLYDEATVGGGRYVSLYGRGEDETDPLNTFGFVVSVFKDFVPDDEPQNLPASLEYFSGLWENGTTLDRLFFLDFLLEADMDDNDVDDALESLDVYMAFVNAGTGRAEVNVTGGDLGTDSLEVVECWDSSINQTHILGELVTPSNRYPIGDLDSGTDVSACGTTFQNNLASLGVPSRADVDQALWDALTEAANTGLVQP